jgi:hypothetical protein
MHGSMGAVGIWNGWWGDGESSTQIKTGATIAWKTNPTNTRKLGQHGKRMGQEKKTWDACGTGRGTGSVNMEHGTERGTGSVERGGHIRRRAGAARGRGRGWVQIEWRAAREGAEVVGI